MNLLGHWKDSLKGLVRLKASITIQGNTTQRNLVSFTATIQQTHFSIDVTYPFYIHKTDALDFGQSLHET
jgi:hypothetical protein